MRLALLLGASALVGCAAPTVPVPANRAEPFFVGRWAPRAENCAAFAWSLAPQRLETPDGGVCAWTRTTTEGERLVLHAVCTGVQDPGPAEISLARTSAGAISLESQVWHERITLRRCGAER
ncbi:MAG TPA: hypothetical protein VF699_14200 [Caulobacteraceae bacterium]|jgi:hypothetical protein